jgi:predicted transcriptional regulator
MATVKLKPDLAEQIDYLASQNQTDPETFVNEALRAYITQLRHQKIRAETTAFEEQRETLLARYRDQYVAIHNGQVIDHDSDLRKLHLRIFDRLEHTPVLLKRVTAEPDRELVFRSPRFESDSS